MGGASVHPVWGLPSLAPCRLIGARSARQGYGDMDWPGACTLLSHLPLPMWPLIYHKTFAFQEIGISKVQNGNLEENPADVGSSLVVTQASLSGNHLPGWGLQLDSALDISLAQVLHAVIIPSTVASYLMGQQLNVWYRQLSIRGEVSQCGHDAAEWQRRSRATEHEAVAGRLWTVAMHPRQESYPSA